MAKPLEVDKELDRHNLWTTLIQEDEDIQELVRVLRVSLQLAKMDGEMLRVSIQQVDMEDLI